MKIIDGIEKYIAIFAIILLLVAGAAFIYVNSKSEKVETNKTKVVATIFPQYDFVRQIAGDNVDLKMLLKPGAEHHSYEPTPQDIKDIKNADLFIYAGGESDVWVDKILRSMKDEKKQPKAVALIDLVKTVNEEHVEGMQPEEDEDHAKDEKKDQKEDEKDNHAKEEKKENHEDEEEPEVDEHVWTSPANAKQIVEKLAVELEKLDSKNAETYKKNALAYTKKLDEVDKEFKDVISKSKKKLLVFGDRFPFRYFVDRYGLKYYAAFPGCSADTQASASTVAFLIDKVKENNVKTVLKIELSKADMADSIAKATGAKVATLNSAHNISGTDFANGRTFLDILKDNVKVIKEALN